MRAIVGTTLILLLTGAAGFALCRVLGVDPHAGDLLTAGLIALIASLAGATPLIICRRAAQPAAAQAGLVSTMAHLFTAIALAGVVYLGMKPAQAFTYWLFAFYGMSLIIIAAESVRLVRIAPPADPAAKH